MKKLKALTILIAILVVFLYGSGSGMAAMIKEAHEWFLYPVVRVTIENIGGSGTIVYSKQGDQGFSNYVLTNFHVVSEAVKIDEEWDPKIQRKVKKERRSVLYAEIFKYKNLDIPIGTMKVEADLVAYNKQEDMALLKLRLTDSLPHVAKLPKFSECDNYNLFDETVAVGCSLGFPPIATPGILTRKNVQIDSLPYHMSTSQIIYGNSGGAMFLSNYGTLIGIPSLVAVVGWNTPITHMGLFIPIDRIYRWLEEEDYDFLFRSEKTEKECLQLRQEKVKKSRQRKED